MPVQNAEPKTVLIADDDAWLREMLSCLLADEGFRPIEATTGTETVHVARQRVPDAILLDIGLPGRSGFQVLEDLRSRTSTCDIPVLLISGEINLLDTGYARDANAAFHKPLDFSAFLAKLHETTHG